MTGDVRPPRPSPRVAFLLAALVLLASPVGAGAQALDPEELLKLSLEELMALRVAPVTSASKYAQPATTAPAAITVIDAEEIRGYGHRNLSDILATVEGCYIRNDRNYEYLGVRGVSRPGDYTNRALLLVNGHRINDPIYQGAMVGSEFPLDVADIERVEVARGPAYAAFGNNALLAVINVITRAPAPGSRGPRRIRAEAEYGTDADRRIRAAFTGGGPGWGHVEISGSARRSDGAEALYFPEFDRPNDGLDGVARKQDGEAEDRLAGFWSRDGLMLQAAWCRREKMVPTASYATDFADPRFETVDTRSYVEARLERPVGKQNLLTGRLAWDSYSSTGEYPYEDVINVDEARSRGISGEVFVTRSRPDRYTITAGAELARDYRLEQVNRDIDPVEVYLHNHARETTRAGYLQGELTALPGFTLGTGLRYDHFESSGGTFNPRISAVYRRGDETSLKLIWGTGFRAPNVLELYYDDQSTMKGNRELHPEESRTLQLTWERQISARFRATGSAYRITLDELIDQVIDPADSMLVFLNTGEVRTWGVETALEGRTPGGWRLRASYSLQETRSRDGNRLLGNSPRHLGKLNLLVPVRRDRLQAGFEAQYQSEVLSVSGGRIPGFWRVNTTLSLPRLAPRMGASLTAYNLFDAEIAHAAGPEHLQERILQDGRTVRLRLNWRL